jgi:hypothetical protein
VWDRSQEAQIRTLTAGEGPRPSDEEEGPKPGSNGSAPGKQRSDPAAADPARAGDRGAAGDVGGDPRPSPASGTGGEEGGEGREGKRKRGRRAVGIARLQAATTTAGEAHGGAG